ncbi:hypothetical protein BOTBODRAFT_29247 [Botryobasidium botryosum FD-172 SS1]|uniref:Cytochrome P450 n=1 Tax=Botryobasidium botryosum (strain FD-172 SS1) TaxID=930990 RepID=A0A067MTA7_BOTB1|nr:hypothetical protein BOTBODRAFT_29247 [Botryobasidium botryosum FD-172 SS1]
MISILISIDDQLRESALVWIALLTLGTVLFFTVQRQLNAGAHRYPPGPKPRPFYSTVRDVPLDSPWLKFTEWAREYGDIVYLRVRGKPVVILSSYQAISDLFEKRSGIYADRTRRILAGLMGWSCVLPFLDYGPSWKTGRRILHQGLSKRAVKTYDHVQQREIHAFLRRLLEEMNQDKPPVELFRRYAGAIILRIIYGHDVTSDTDDYVERTEKALRALAHTGIPGGALVDTFTFLQYVPAWMPGAGWKKRALQERERIFRQIKEPFEDAKKGMENGSLPACLVSTLLEDSHADKELEEIICWACGSMYSGGIHTTVATFSTFLLAMLHNPQVALKAQAELDKEVGLNCLPTLNDRDRLPYVNALLCETLRYYTVTPLAIPHRLKQDDIYRGYLIPKDATVFSNLYAISHDERMYPHPHEFRPERFLEPSETVVDPYDYCFGIGRRSCPGNHLADATLFLTVASILAAFDIRKAVDEKGEEIDAPFEFTPGLVSGPKPFRCQLVPRSERAAELVRSTGSCDIL